jgi:hypothetical protein
MEENACMTGEIEINEEQQEGHIIFCGRTPETPQTGLAQAREIIYGDETAVPRPTDDLNCGKLSKLVNYIIKGSIGMSAWFCYAEAVTSKA